MFKRHFWACFKRRMLITCFKNINFAFFTTVLCQGMLHGFWASYFDTSWALFSPWLCREMRDPENADPAIKLLWLDSENPLERRFLKFQGGGWGTAIWQFVNLRAFPASFGWERWFEARTFGCGKQTWNTYSTTSQKSSVCVCVDEMLNAEIILGKLSLFRYLKHNLVSGMEPLLTLCKAKEDLYKRHNFFFKIRRYNPGVMEWTVASGVFGQLLLRRVRNFMDSLMDPNCSLTWTIARVLKRTSLKFST